MTSWNVETYNPVQKFRGIMGWLTRTGSLNQNYYSVLSNNYGFVFNFPLSWSWAPHWCLSTVCHTRYSLLCSEERRLNNNTCCRWPFFIYCHAQIRVHTCWSLSMEIYILIISLPHKSIFCLYVLQFSSPVTFKKGGMFLYLFVWFFPFILDFLS